MSPRRLAAGCGIALLSACLQAVPAEAETATPVQAAIRSNAVEGPIFTLPAGIRITRQDITMNPRHVTLSYVFQGAQRHTVPFRFELPEMPVDASPDVVGLLDGGGMAEGLAADSKPVNYMNLSVHVNGAPLMLTGRGRALQDGQDVTRILLDAGVPLLYDLNHEAPWSHLPAQTQAMLKARGLLSLDAANWNYQVRYTWDQVFEPGETRVEIHYNPDAFYWSDINLDNFPPIAAGGWANRTYCLDEAWRRTFFRLAGSGAGYELYAVMHVLAPKGAPPPPAAARYSLKVDKYASPNLVAFCPADAKKTSPSTFTWQARNVTPGRTVDALFFMGPDGWPDD
ncbi:DUF4424 family protein [Castellaniella hirudinis]|uniref:DUF4424 family protein n=1 Tax=Castellaniella hirudinis TaxID=1144617 RepID=A0ABV8S2P4_9BURK